MAVADLLQKAGLFQHVNIAHLEGRIQQVSFEAGDIVVREGEPGDAAYIIESGSVQVYITTVDGAEIVTARLQVGAHFGEQALLQPNNCRNASIRAAEDLVLLRIPAEAMLEILVGDSAFREELAKLGREQDAQRFARQSALFKSMPLEDFQRLQLHETRYGAGEIVFAEGDVGDKVYLIISGRAAAYKDQDGSPTLSAVIDTGQCFGEMAVVGHTRRAVTIIAEGELQTLWIDAASFAAMLGQTPQLQRYITTLNRMYQLPRRGFITQGTGTLMGEDATTCIYHLVDGSTVIAARTVDDRIFSMKRGGRGDDDGETFKFDAPATGVSVEITIAGDGMLMSITTVGEWEDLGTACDIILRGDKLDRWRASVFSLTGRLQLESAPKFGGDDELFCTCVQVRLGTIREAIVGGAPNAEAVIHKTNCGTVCGSCRPRLAELMGQNAWTPVRVGEVIEHTADIRSFQLVPWNGEFDKPALPGQHIVVEGLIDGKWIRRSYTLTSHPSERRFREITVKREQHGIFSSWLFQADDKALMRVSDPGGEVVAGDGDEPIVSLVGGIGVTPGLVMCRTFSNGLDRRVHVDYSVRDLREAICLDEFRGYGEAKPTITFKSRVTSQGGRISRADIESLLKDMPDATFFICGPAAYEAAVSKLVAEAGVALERIKVETFTQAGGAVAAPVKSPAATLRPKLPPLKPQEFPYKPIKADEYVDVFDEAKAFLTQLFFENGVLAALPARLREVEKEIARTGTYAHTYDELAYGCKIAWRNSVYCIGRVFWPAMKVIDARHLRDEREIFNALVDHLRYATNGGRIRCLTTFFSPTGVHLWNHQLIRFAGYRQSDGSIIGDPSQVEVTEQALALGWPGGKRTPFDVLPLIIQVEDRPPQWFELPEDAVLMVPIVHPRYRWFEEMDLKWHAVPIATDSGFDMGGIKYHLMPFNGWYMSAEIGSRNFCDPFRYDMVPKIAEKMGLDMSSEATLWRDRALVEMNFAVLHSYARMGVTLVDHHTITRKFMEYVAAERGCGREVFTNWAWTVPPISGSQTPVFHVDFDGTRYKPMLFRMPRPWELVEPAEASPAQHA